MPKCYLVSVITKIFLNDVANDAFKVNDDDLIVP
jgi:hypothetical protein